MTRLLRKLYLMIVVVFLKAKVAEEAKPDDVVVFLKAKVVEEAIPAHVVVF